MKAVFSVRLFLNKWNTAWLNNIPDINFIFPHACAPTFTFKFTHTHMYIYTEKKIIIYHAYIDIKNNIILFSNEADCISTSKMCRLRELIVIKGYQCRVKHFLPCCTFLQFLSVTIDQFTPVNMSVCLVRHNGSSRKEKERQTLVNGMGIWLLKAAIGWAGIGGWEVAVHKLFKKLSGNIYFFSLKKQYELLHSWTKMRYTVSALLHLDSVAQLT